MVPFSESHGPSLRSSKQMCRTAHLVPARPRPGIGPARGGRRRTPGPRLGGPAPVSVDRPALSGGVLVPPPEPHAGLFLPRVGVIGINNPLPQLRGNNMGQPQ